MILLLDKWLLSAFIIFSLITFNNGENLSSPQSEASTSVDLNVECTTSTAKSIVNYTLDITESTINAYEINARKKSPGVKADVVVTPDEYKKLFFAVMRQKRQSGLNVRPNQGGEGGEGGAGGAGGKGGKDGKTVEAGAIGKEGKQGVAHMRKGAAAISPCFIIIVLLALVLIIIPSYQTISIGASS